VNITTEQDVSSSYVRCTPDPHPTVWRDPIADDVIAETFQFDRLDADSPRLIVPDEARELKAQLTVRTAYELFDPVRFPPNMHLFAVDTFRLACWYSVTTERVAEVVRVAAEGLVAAWRREASA
jgi:hypothetical protein